MVFSRTPTATIAGPKTGMVQFQTSVRLTIALKKLALKWRCSTDQAAQRVVIMALSGWRLKFEEPLVKLSAFVTKHEEPFQQTCVVLRGWINTWTEATGETLSETDVAARLEFLLETLKERQAEGQLADLVELLENEDAEDDEHTEDADDA